MHFVAALDLQQGMRGVLCLFEGVVSGAADGYARMVGKPACTLLHLGPGLANSLANLHNARRAFSPIVNIVGDHATYHRALDAPLTSDILGLARPVSGWLRLAESADQVATDAAAAVQAALGPPNCIATLVLPADSTWNEPARPVAAQAIPKLKTPDQDNIKAAITALRSGEPCALLMNGRGVTEAALRSASQIQQASGARLLGDTFIARTPRGAGRVDLPRLPYFAEQAEPVLKGLKHLILVDTNAPVSFFAYPGRASELSPTGCTAHRLTTRGEDAEAALAQTAEALGASRLAPLVSERLHPGPMHGPINAASAAAVVAALLPEQAIVVNEALTSGAAMAGPTQSAAPHDLLDVTGGAIGMGIPAAVGAAIACPDRQVVSLQGDGGGMYAVQGLWTQAREGLDITTIIFSNRKYAILQMEFMRAGTHNLGPKAMDLLQLDRPDLDWVAMAAGMGVPGQCAETAEDLAAALAKGLATPGPFLIEAVMAS